MKLLGNFIAVKRLEVSETKTPGGLHIPITALKNWIEAEVLEIGTGWTDQNGVTHPIDEVCPGDKVIVDEYSLATMRIPKHGNVEVCGLESVRWNLTTLTGHDLLGETEY